MHVIHFAELLYINRNQTIMDDSYCDEQVGIMKKYW